MDFTLIYFSLLHVWYLNVFHPRLYRYMNLCLSWINYVETLSLRTTGWQIEKRIKNQYSTFRELVITCAVVYDIRYSIRLIISTEKILNKDERLLIFFVYENRYDIMNFRCTYEYWTSCKILNDLAYIIIWRSVFNVFEIIKTGVRTICKLCTCVLSASFRS